MIDFKAFCENKSIAVIGNSSILLNNKFGLLIDAHDIVVRINNAPKYICKYPENAGHKTTVMSYGMSNLRIAKQMSNICNPEYTLFLIRCNGAINTNDYTQFKNAVHGDIQEYSELKSNFTGYKPSTGIVTINYFFKNIKFSKLSLYGFDCFESSSGFKINQFGSYLYKDHNQILERSYLNKLMKDNIINIY